jgi:hypothetical protein
VISRAGYRGARWNVVPVNQATGIIAICVLPSGTPSRSRNSSRLPRMAVVHAVPRPRARSATQKLHTDWMTESNSPGRPLPSCTPTIVGITIAGTSARCSARYADDFMTFSCG